MEQAVYIFYFNNFFASMVSVAGSCNEVLLNWKGEIKSPSQTDYPGDRKCVWTIRTDSIRRIALSARSFDVHVSQYCWHDYVIINNGAKTYRLCGQYFPTIYSTANTMLVEFHNKLKGGSFHLDYRTYYRSELQVLHEHKTY